METDAIAPATFNFGFACGIAFCVGVVGSVVLWALVIKKGVGSHG